MFTRETYLNRKSLGDLFRGIQVVSDMILLLSDTEHDNRNKIFCSRITYLFVSQRTTNSYLACFDQNVVSLKLSPLGNFQPCNVNFARNYEKSTDETATAKRIFLKFCRKTTRDLALIYLQ